MNIKPYIIAAITAVVFLGIAILAWRSGNGPAFVKPSADTKILFWGVGCPHCVKVDEFLQRHPEIETKVAFEKREAFQNANNAQLLFEKNEVCNLPEEQRGTVPLFFDGKSCISGDVDIISYFQQFVTPTSPVSTSSTN
ncbi:MAG: hypothetical protein WCV84_00195 [Patescibacteria group bacterium]